MVANSDSNTSERQFASSLSTQTRRHRTADIDLKQSPMPKTYDYVDHIRMTVKPFDGATTP
jgi:hypothetical protein